MYGSVLAEVYSRDIGRSDLFKLLKIGRDSQVIARASSLPRLEDGLRLRKACDGPPIQLRRPNQFDSSLRFQKVHAICIPRRNYSVLANELILHCGLSYYK